MGETAGNGATWDVSDLNRRGFAAGLIGAGLLAGGVARAQSAPFETSIPRSPDPTVPPPLIDEAALTANLLTRMATRTELNGRTGFRFVIDTGAGRTAIAQDVADALDLPPGPPILVHGVTSAEIAPTVRLARLTFGQRRFNDLLAPVFPRQLLGADGLLGLDVLSRFELLFNLNRRTVHLTPSGADVMTVDRTFTIPTRLSRTSAGRARTGRHGQMILINTLAENVPVEAFVDSGAQYSIGNLALQRAIGAAPARGEQSRRINIYGVTGQTLLAEPGLVRQLEVSRQKLGPTPLLFADLYAFHALDLIDRPALLIGADILYRFGQVRLDFGRSRMAFNGLRRPVRTAAA